MVRVEGVIARSCKMEGCWAELAFFIPLQSAGAFARAEGVFTVKTITKPQVDHMIAEDGVKFDKRKAAGTVIEVSFEATGIELKKQ